MCGLQQTPTVVDPPVSAAPTAAKDISIEEVRTQSRWGLPLGALLGVTISVVVASLLGGLTALQLRRDELRERASRQERLAESLAPLAAEVAQASSLAEIERLLSSFRLGEIARNGSGYEVMLLDSRGRIVFSSDAEGGDASADDSLRASLAVRSEFLATGVGSLMAWQDGSELTAEMALRRREAWLEIGVTAWAVIVVVQLAIYLLVSRPLNRLLTAIDRFEQGYPAGFPNGAIARELSRLGWRLHSLSIGLTNSARLLVAAHRRASEASKLRRDRDVEPMIVDPLELDRAEAAAGNEVIRRYLLDRCALIEGCRPDDPTARDIALEIWDHDVLEAERLGEMEVRVRLEDAALKILDPIAFDRVRRGLAATADAQGAWWEATGEAIEVGLSSDGVQLSAIQRRTKNVAGVWRKMQEKHLAVEDVQDLFGFRIIVPERDDCYLALESVHRLFEPEPFRFKDYIAEPKANGYQSLHTSVRDRHGIVFEVQIRSVAMHTAAEQGIAAHWRYRAGTSVRPRNGLGRPGGQRIPAWGLWRTRDQS